MLLYFVLHAARVAELADFADAATGVVAVLPDDVLATVRRADDVGPVQQATLCSDTRHGSCECFSSLSVGGVA